MSMKNSNDNIGNRTRNLPTVSTLTLLKSGRIVSGNLVLTKMLLISSFHTATHDHPQAWKHRKQTKNSNGFFFPIYLTAQNLPSHISTSLGPSNTSPVEKGLTVMTRLLKKWLWVQKSN